MDKKLGGGGVRRGMGTLEDRKICHFWEYNCEVSTEYVRNSVGQTHGRTDEVSFGYNIFCIYTIRNVWLMCLCDGVCATPHRARFISRREHKHTSIKNSVT